MELGAFSVSLAVKDIEKSKTFYEKLGFNIVGGDQPLNWLIMRNRKQTIGLFQGMFEDNILTFNPGWDQDCNTLNSFTDVRELHKHFTSKGIEITSDTFSKSTGPASFTLIDPDGNPILIDQHV